MNCHITSCEFLKESVDVLKKSFGVLRVPGDFSRNQMIFLRSLLGLLEIRLIHYIKFIQFLLELYTIVSEYIA